VVIADDEVHVANLIERILKPFGVEVVKTYDGEEAWRAVLERRRRVLVTDVMMPKLRGDELCRRVKASPETAGVAVLIVSSQTARSVVEAGADAFISKPFELDHVEKVFLRLLEASVSRDGH